MERTHIVKTRVDSLNENLKVLESRKKYILDYSQKLYTKYVIGDISREFYLNALYEKHDGRTLQEWVNFYDFEIQNCKKQIQNEIKNQIKSSVIIIAIAIAVVLGLIFFITRAGFNFTGFSIQEEKQTFTENLNLDFSEAVTYNWQIQNLGQLLSTKISGTIKGQNRKNVKVYLDEFLLLDSSKLEDTPSPSSSSSETIPGEAQNQTSPFQESPLDSEKMIEFSDICEDACNLESLNFNKTSYILRIEIENAELSLDKIVYETLNIIEAPEQNITNITEENITQPEQPEQNLTEPEQETPQQNITEPEQNITIPEINQTNITEIPEAIEVPEIANITEINQTNITEVNVTNITEVNITNITKINATISILVSNITLGQPVKWKKVVNPQQTGNLTLEIPAQAENIVIKKTRENKPKTTGFSITGAVISQEDEISGGFLTKLFAFISRLFSRKSGSGLTGFAVEQQNSEEKIKNKNKSREKKIQLEINEVTEYTIEYETPAPTSIEQPLAKGKQVIVSGPDTIHYENVLAFTNLNESLNIKNPDTIKIHWIENNTFISPSSVQDKDSNGIYDYIEWIVPHLSTQTFEIIVITKADHLNKNRLFIQDIYESVKEQEGIWSPTISNNEYVRVTFEENLTSKKDITIFPRVISGKPVIEVYEKDKQVKIAEFNNINSSGYNKIYLTNLGNNTQDTFDLKIVKGKVEFDHIIDPVIYPGALGATTTYGRGTQEKIVRLNSGELISVWSDAASDLWCSSSTDNGLKWINKEIANTVTYLTPTIVTNGTRIIIAVEEDVNDSIETAYSDEGCAGTFNFVDIPGTDIVAEGIFPEMAMGPDGMIHHCSISGADDLIYSQSTDGGVTFSEANFFDTANNDECDIEVDGNGMVWIVTSDRGLDDVHLFNSSDGFNTFTTQIVDAGSADMWPSITIGKDNQIYLTWTYAANNIFRFANSSDGASWSIQSVSTENSIVGDTLYSVGKINNDTGEIYVFYDQDISDGDYAVFLANSSDNGLSWTHQRLHTTYSGDLTTDDAYLTSPRGSSFPDSNRITNRLDYTYIDDTGTTYEVVFKTIPDNFPSLNTSGIILTTSTNLKSVGYVSARVYDKEQQLISDHLPINGTYSESARSWQKFRCLEKRNECVLLWNDVQNDINFEVYNLSDNTWNSYTLLASALPDDNTQSFDVECEDLSGECLIVYRPGEISGRSIAYRIYNDSGLSEQNVWDNLEDVDGILEWAKLYPKPNSDEIMLGVEDSNLDIYAILWNGTENNFSLSTRLAATAAGPLADRKSFEYAWEGSSGEGLFVYGTTTDGIYAYTFSEYAWTSLGRINNIGARAYNIDMCGSDPLMGGTNHDYIGIIIEDQDSDLSGFMWNGTGLESGYPTQDSSSETVTATNYARCMWESQSKNQSVFIWTDADDLTPCGGSYTLDSGWDFSSFENDNQTGIPTFSDDAGGLTIYPDPNSNEMFILGQDLAEDVNFFVWNGTWFDDGLAKFYNPLEIITPSSLFRSESFDYKRYNPPVEQDESYPLFSNYWDNNATLQQSGTGLFNITVENTNGTVILEINNTNITATNFSLNVYNVSYDFNSPEVYPYQWHSWGNGTDKNYNYSETRNYLVNESVSNTAPTIPIVQTLSSQSPIEGTTKPITFYFTAEDSDGTSNLDDATARVYFQKTGETTRYNESCVAGATSGNQKNYSCTIDMWYFDKAGLWTINASIKDLDGEYAENSSTTFSYETLTAMKLSPTSMNWPENILPTQTDISSNTNPIIVNNTGNAENMNIQVTALDLRGLTDTSKFIFANNFSAQAVSDGCSGNSLVNNSGVTITSAILQRGNNSLNYENSDSGQQKLYFCLKALPQGIISQQYSSSGLGSWTIKILLVAFAPALKKKKQKKKLNKNNKILNLAIKLTDELKEDYSKEKEILINQLTKSIREEYGVSKKEISLLLRKEQEIPITIFSNQLGALEAIIKYMKENLNLSYHEIAIIIGRDERTIWTAYHKATQKQPEPIVPKQTEINLPLSAFGNKELTILEFLIITLKQKGLKLTEIAELLQRDQRNIWLINSRASKKLNE